ncbi:paraquat-inducible protein A [Myxococcota bacterium]|nr:paraquat-inducible protein A [Myxococcota bacterium]
MNTTPFTCDECGLQCRTHEATGGTQRCPHCHARIERRKPGSAQRTAALLIAAGILYIPANLLPIFEVQLLGRTSNDTILEGVAQLIASGMWMIGAVVFIASIAVPLLKILGIGTLLLASRFKPDSTRLGRARLFRVVEAIGPWSMIDIFVVSLMVSLVRFGTLATFAPGPGAVCFACVVILTMLAVRGFDPRTIWDPVEEKV